MRLQYLEQYSKDLYERLFGRFHESIDRDINMRVHFDHWYDEESGTFFLIKGRSFGKVIRLAYCHPRTHTEIYIENEQSVFCLLRELNRRFACGVHPYTMPISEKNVLALPPEGALENWLVDNVSTSRRFFHLCLQKIGDHFTFLCFTEDMIYPGHSVYRHYGQGHTIFQAIQMSSILIRK